MRKQIVATTEGGAITGEERLREHTDQLYGAILSYEGKPADYQIARIDSLRRELDDAVKDFEGLLTNELPKLNDQLKAKGQPAIEPPPAKVALNEPETGGGGSLFNGVRRSRFADKRGVASGRLPIASLVYDIGKTENAVLGRDRMRGARPSGGTCFRRSGLYRCDRLA